MKIGFTGPYCTANFGDWAMLVNNIFDFGIENEYTVFTYSNSFPHNAIKHYFSDCNVSLLEVLLKDDIQHIETPTPLDLLEAISNMEELYCSVKQLDVLVVSGGGWIDDVWCKRTAKFFKVFTPIIIATQLGIPIRFMAQGIGPVKELEDTLRLFLNYCRKDTVFALRDDYCSPVFLNVLVNEKYPIRYLPDDLAIINQSLAASFEKSSYKIDSPYVVLVINDEINSFTHNIEIFQQFCEMLQRKYKYKIVILPFDLVWFGEEQSNLLHQCVPESILIDIHEKKFVPIEDTVSIIRGAELVLTGRHHAAVIAMWTHTPFVLKLDNNRHHYAYNKAYGVYSTFTTNIQYDESLFIKTEWSEVFECIEKHCENILNLQKKVFENVEYDKNYQKLYKQRIDYIESIKKANI